jgi:hypothetical protein
MVLVVVVAVLVLLVKLDRPEVMAQMVVLA